MKLIKQGAEATIYKLGNNIIKERLPKNYRIEQIDNKIRKFRTKREAKILEKSPVKVPKIISVNEDSIKMELIDGELVKNILNGLDEKKRTKLFNKIGQDIRKLHDKNIIHGDLTTSNLLVKDGEIYFIDFGLGFFSAKIEDKAVDVHLIKQVLNSRHHEFFPEFDYLLKGYGADKEFLAKLSKIEGRGRYKND